jgi:hypothetical protein
MPNPTTGLFQTLVAASNSATKNLTFENAMIDCVYREFQPVAKTPGQAVTLTVNIPTVSEGDVANIAGGPLRPTDTAHDSVSIPFDQKLSTSWTVANWDEIRSPEDLAEKYMQPRMESLLRAVNRQLANLVTETNFNIYTRIDSAGADTFVRADFGTAWNNLAGRGVPVSDSKNIFFVTTPLAYKGMVGATDFYQESIVGVEASMAAAQRAMIAPAFNARIRWDQQIPQYATGTKESGLFFHRNAIAMVTAPLPKSQTGAIKEYTVFPRPGLAFQVQMQDSLLGQGTLIAINCAFGVAVVRPDHGSFLASA